MKHCYFVLLLLGSLAWGQNQNLKELNYNEFLGYVKKYHPLVKSAQLEINMAQANLMMARGGFDPKIEADFDQKQFMGKEYYSVFNSSFKIPTWYGIEVKAGFDNSEGIFVNPENSLPNQGLTSLGITVPVGQGLFINQRMADLRKAKIQIRLSQAERKLQAIEVLYNASLAYFNWKRNHSEVQLYSTYLNNAKLRYKGIKTLINNGDKPAIDSVEAGIVVKTRQWNLEESKLKLAKSKLDLSNYLWLDNNIPLELQDDVLPENKLEQTISATLKINQLITDTISIENHPKINSLENKLAILEVDRKLKANSLLPKMDVGYHYLSEPNYWNDTNFNNYKIGVNFKFPLFLRKERGSLQLAKFKIQDTKLSLDLERIQLKNKITAQQTEIKSIEKQLQLISSLVSGNGQMLQSEERLFSLGESSIFLINARENNLVSIQLTQLGLENRFLNSNAELFKIMANPD
jgi:outer membrane protein TolC